MFQLKKDQIRNLDPEQLRELIARLCEAEVAAKGMPRSAVSWGGAQTAKDGGLDVEVRLADEVFRGDFVPRPRTGIQVKKSKMPPGKIRSEMAPGGKLRTAIADIASGGGAYLIVSLNDDPANKPLRDRETAMQGAVAGCKGAESVELRFLGRNEITRWLEAHPSVQLWVREQLGIPISGWRAFGRWSMTPADVDDTLIIEDGVGIQTPLNRGEQLGMVEGINQMRTLVRGSSRAIRVVGLSGVGKSRIVQALFEEDVGDEPLDQTCAIYADLGDDLMPSAINLLDRLIAEGRVAILVLDNCPAELHGQLAKKVASNSNSIRLITIEYDIRDDTPERTNVVRIAAIQPVAVATLLIRRFPHIEEANAQRVARFAEGNARLALALAERLDEGESIAALSDETLFNRLFDQRHTPNDDLRRGAEVLSLVYSFSIEPEKNGRHELETLARLSRNDCLWLYNTAQELLARQLAQKRGRWRAILPQAIANRLAAVALNRFPPEWLREVFERDASDRLLSSFARRLGYLHNHDVAVSIVRAWLSRGGLLADIGALNTYGIRMLRNAAPADPEAVLVALERFVAEPKNVERLIDERRNDASTIIEILRALAYDETRFDRCINALVAFARHERDDRTDESIRQRLFELFSLYLSGTKAEPERRVQTVQHYLGSDDPTLVSLGMGMLKMALQRSGITGDYSVDFGAWLRDEGYVPASRNEEVAWYAGYLNMIFETLCSTSDDGRNALRELLAECFRDLWHVPELREYLVRLLHRVNQQRFWPEGWRAVRETLYFHNRRDRGGRIVRAPLYSGSSPKHCGQRTWNQRFDPIS